MFENYLKCKDIAKRLGDRILQSQVAMAMGDAYTYLGENGASIGPFEEAFNLARKSNDIQLQMHSLIMLAKSLLYQGKYQNAALNLVAADALMTSGIGKEVQTYREKYDQFVLLRQEYHSTKESAADST